MDFIFAVMLSNDKRVSDGVEEMQKTIEANQSEIADLRELLGGEEPDKTPRQKGTAPSSRERSEVDLLKKNLSGLEQKVAKLLTASVTVGADGAHNIQIDSVDKSNLLIDKSVPDGKQQKSRYEEPQKSSSPLSEKAKARGLSQSELSGMRGQLLEDLLKEVQSEIRPELAKLQQDIAETNEKVEKEVREVQELRPEVT